MKTFEIREGLYIGVKGNGEITLAQESWRKDNTFTEIHLKEEDISAIAKIINQKSEEKAK